jgi:hypothetical protein
MTHIHVQSNIGIGLIGMAYSFGSDFEVPGRFGTSHLMEHLMCKPFDYLLPKLKQLGVNYNAYTSENRVVFYFTGLYESLSEIGEIIYNSIIDGKFKCTEEAFNIEKSIVLQEYGDVFNDQVSGTIENIIRKHYNYFGAIGLKSDIVGFKYEDYLNSISGFNKPYMLCEVGQSYIPTNNDSFVHRYTINGPTQFAYYNVPIEDVPKEDKTIVGLICKETIKDRITANKVKFIDDCLNSGLESPLYQEIREKRGLAYGSYSFLQQVYNRYILTYCAVTTNEKASELKSVYGDFFVGDLSRHITQKRFNECHQSIMINKKMLSLLPHDWAYIVILGEDKFEGLDNFTYDEAISMLSDHFRYNIFEGFDY